MKATKKAIEIEYIIFEASLVGFIRLKNFVGDKLASYSGGKVILYTQEGTITATIGDYIIKGVKGEFYPCKPDIFKLTYDYEEELTDTQKEIKLLEIEQVQIEKRIDELYLEVTANTGIYFCILSQQRSALGTYAKAISTRLVYLRKEKCDQKI